jgi:[ribosomal protein S5]-alanine N-acetyltransferase
MIETPRLLLRRARMSDLADFHAIFSDPRAMRYWSTPPNADLGQTERWLEGMVASTPPGSNDLAIAFEGRVIGKAGCWQCPEIGIILHTGFWGRGLAREALEAALPYCFATLPTTFLTADVDPRNARSLRLLNGLGFREAGRAARTYCVAGEWCDSVYLRLDRQAPPGA